MALPDPNRSRAVLIGASRFVDPELPDLPAVRNNLDGLAACLCEPALWGLPSAHCTLVADPDSGVALVDAVHDAAAEAEDTLLIYYAGHGLVHPRTLALLLAVAGSTPGRPHTAVPYDQVRDNVLDSPAKRKVVILDCCYSGRAVGGMADPTTAVANEATVEGTYLLASAPPNRQALAPPGETYTAFTGALLTLIRQGVPNGPELLQLDAIYRHVRDALRRRALPEPQLRVDNTAGELALVRNHWHRPPATPLPDVPAITIPTVLTPKHPVRDRNRERAVRERLKKLIRETGMDRSHACPVCAAEVSGHNFIRHYDKHTPSETAALDPATLTLDTGRRHLLGERYDLVQLIAGETGTTKIYFATDTATGHSVVVRQLPDDRFDERRSRLDHPGLVRVLDIIRVKRTLHVVTEHVDGRPLTGLLPMPPRTAVEVMIAVCDVLAYAHQQRVLVGNLNARNVMLTRDSTVKLLSVELDDAGDIRSDLYAAGRLLFEMLTGSQHVLTSPALTQVRLDIPPDLDRIVHTALHPDSSQRYRTATAMRADLQDALRDNEPGFHVS